MLYCEFSATTKWQHTTWALEDLRVRTTAFKIGRVTAVVHLKCESRLIWRLFNFCGAYLTKVTWCQSVIVCGLLNPPSSGTPEPHKSHREVGLRLSDSSAQERGAIEPLGGRETCSANFDPWWSGDPRDNCDIFWPLGGWAQKCSIGSLWASKLDATVSNVVARYWC